MINDRKIITDEELKQELIKIPDFNTYKQNLIQLDKLDKTSSSLAEISKIFFKNAVLFLQSAGFLPKETINLGKFSRVRLNINQVKEDIQLIRTFSYPPTNFCENNGRANIKYKSVFYCADTIETALAESKPKINDIAYLSTWHIQSDRDCRYAPFLIPRLPKVNPWFKDASDIYQVVVEYSKKLGNDKSMQLELLFNFISELYIKEVFPYPLTSWLSHVSMYEDYGTDFIIYPSYTLNSISCNFAFHPNFVDNYFKLDRVYKLWIRDVTKDGTTFIVLEVGKIFLTNIKWSKPTEEDISLFNSDGNNVKKEIINPDELVIKV